MRRRARLLLSLVALVLVGVLSEPIARAQTCDPALTARIDDHLRREARRARTWNTTWAFTYGGLAALQLGAALGEWLPHKDVDRVAKIGLYVGATKAALGSLARIVTPLKLTPPPAPTADACVDLKLANAALARAAHKEKMAFWLQHAGSIAANAAGLLYLGLAHDAWKEGLVSLSGYPVGLIAIYTQPRRAWRAHKRGYFAPVVSGSYGGVVLAFDF